MDTHIIEVPDLKVLNLITAEQAHHFQLIPIAIEGTALTCYSREDSPVQFDELSFIIGLDIKWTSLPGEEFDRHLVTCYPSAIKDVQLQKESVADRSDVVEFVDQIFQEAIAVSASDIHIERYEKEARVRYRWEGKLIEKFEIDLSQYDAIVSRIKIMAELDISERRLPQDGRIQISDEKQDIDVRVSTVPSKFGEKVVMRLLTRSASFLNLENLGMREQHLHTYLTQIQQPNGIVLITGPTGSGKTTTLYASLSRLNQADVNILTIEDPIEYNLRGINQVQVKEEIGLSFDKTLRAFLRQDPDIIMVGEIRDQKTAEIAIRAALTGHLVFSTLHTNSAADAISRLVDMGVPAYLLAASLRMIVAQRLVRMLCPHCKKVSDAPPHNIQEQYQLPQVFEPVGCPRCQYTGYSGRKAIYELIQSGPEASRKIKDLQFQDLEPMTSLKDEVLELLQQGKTSLREAMGYLI